MGRLTYKMFFIITHVGVYIYTYIHNLHIRPWVIDTFNGISFRVVVYRVKRMLCML